jgi:hypothetical protein
VRLECSWQIFERAKRYNDECRILARRFFSYRRIQDAGEHCDVRLAVCTKNCRSVSRTCARTVLSAQITFLLFVLYKFINYLRTQAA